MSNLVQPAGRQLEAGREVSRLVTLLDEGLHLVEGEDLAHPVGELAGNKRGVLAERLGGIARFPAAAILQGLGEVPVIERGVGLDAGCQQRVDQPVVEVESLGIGGAASLGKHARPGDREAIGVGPHRLHQRHVFLVAVEVIDADLASRAVPDAAGLLREGVPDRGAAPGFVRGALDLVGRGRGAPAEALGESRGRPARPRGRAGGGMGRSSGRRGQGRGARRGQERAAAGEIEGHGAGRLRSVIDRTKASRVPFRPVRAGFVLRCFRCSARRRTAATSRRRRRTGAPTGLDRSRSGWC